MTVRHEHGVAVGPDAHAVGCWPSPGRIPAPDRGLRKWSRRSAHRRRCSLSSKSITHMVAPSDQMPAGTRVGGIKRDVLGSVGSLGRLGMGDRECRPTHHQPRWCCRSPRCRRSGSLSQNSGRRRRCCPTTVWPQLCLLSPPSTGKYHPTIGHLTNPVELTRPEISLKVVVEAWALVLRVYSIILPSVPASYCPTYRVSPVPQMPVGRSLSSCSISKSSPAGRLVKTR